MNFGNNLVKLRKKERLSQEELAEKVGVTRQTISNWELNETTPDINQASILAKIFNVSIDQLIGNDINEIMLKKVSNTERLSGMIIKFLKIFGISFYFIILIVLLSVTIYFFTHKSKDSTKEYETEFICGLASEEYWISASYENELYYIDIADITNKTNKESLNNTYPVEHLKAGNSYIELVESLQILKKTFLNNGGECWAKKQ